MLENQFTPNVLVKNIAFDYLSLQGGWNFLPSDKEEGIKKKGTEALRKFGWIILKLL